MNPLHNHSRPAVCSDPAHNRVRDALDLGCRVGLSWPAFLLLVWFFAAAVSAQTGQPLITMTNSEWRYDDTATDLGTAWRAVSYPAENQWPTGVGLFGVESTHPSPYAEPVRTALVLNAGRTTYYFRTRFNFTGNPAGLTLRATASVDDGAVFYLNGVELHRVRLPAGPITFTNKAQLASPEGVPVLIDFPATRLAAGANVMAVEVHQHSDTSSDVVFGMTLEFLQSQAPVILDPAEPADRVVPEGESTTLTVVASGFPPPAYQWYRDEAALSGATASTFLLSNMSAEQAGNYFCTLSNASGNITSRTAAVTFLADTNPLAILYALGRESPTEVLVAFSEPPDSGEAEDNFFWQIEEVGGGAQLTVLSGAMATDSTLVLTTIEPRNPTRSYVLRRTEALREQVDRGNAMPAGTEAPIATFVTPLIPNDETHLWRYDQSGADLRVDWFHTVYDDSDWLTGAGVFDAFRSPEAASPCRSTLPGIIPPDDLVRTCLTLSNAANTALIPTIYFRTRFTFDGDAVHSVLRLETIINDGAVFYLNGLELLRLGLPDGAITYNTPASGAGPPAFTYHDLDAPSLVAGENVLAVELHQADLNDPGANRDFTFALKLFGILPSRPPSRLTTRLAGGNLTVSWVPEGGTLESADNPSGPWATVLEAHPPGEYTTTAAEGKMFYRVVAP